MRQTLDYIMNCSPEEFLGVLLVGLFFIGFLADIIIAMLKAIFQR